jgi:hypothetical protein
MLLTDDFLKRWGDIVDEVDKQHIPLNCVRKVVFRSRDRRQKTINLSRLREQSCKDDMIESLIQQYIETHEDTIMSMEFVLDVEAVASQIQPQTDKLLKGM